jgi:hypothetical protein
MEGIRLLFSETLNLHHCIEHILTQFYLNLYAIALEVFFASQEDNAAPYTADNSVRV